MNTKAVDMDKEDLEKKIEHQLYIKNENRKRKRRLQASILLIIALILLLLFDVL